MVVDNRKRDLHLVAGWKRACAAVGRGDGSVIAHPSIPGLFMTPYALDYFKDAVPDALPADRKARDVVIITDLDLRMWKYVQAGPPLLAFDAAMQAFATNTARYDGMADMFFETATVRHLLHTPQITYHTDKTGIALMVLSAAQKASFHLCEMAGVICTDTFSGFSTKAVHNALLRHEWAHLERDDGMSAVDKEIHCDRAAVDGMTDSNLKQAWVDARIVGGFMWPFPARQNGMGLIDPKFTIAPYQDAQMRVIDEWCQGVFETFYQPARVRNMYESLGCGYIETYLEQPVLYYLLAQARQPVPGDAASFKAQLFAEQGENKEVAQRAWLYMTRAYVMHLQVSGARDPELFAGFYQLSRTLQAQAPADHRITHLLHRQFQESLTRILPSVTQQDNTRDYQPCVRNVQMPSFEYRSFNPFID